MQTSPQWIRSPVDTGTAALSFSRSFSVRKPVKNAVLSASAMGVYVPYLNGLRIGKQVLAPGYTSYQNRVQYQSYDITAQITAENTVDLQVGRGWAVYWPNNNRASNDWTREEDIYTDHISLICWIDICYADGTEERLITDEHWTVRTTQITSSEIYHGETIDKTAPIRVLGMAVLDPVETKLIPQEGEWICEHEHLAPAALLHTPKGETVIDFGQNMTGYVQVRIRGNRGDRIVLHHAEVLDQEGNFYTENMRIARNENVYVLSGGEDIFKPSFCFQGFRYIRLTEYPQKTVDLSAFCAIVVHSNIKRTGSFVCGNEKVNQLYHNIIWGQKSNYLDVPTDCPQRNERLGWTGDAQVFCRTGAINFDISRFMNKWLGDMALDQREDGAIPGIIPSSLRTRVSAAWGDAACIIPWELYLAYGDKQQLKKHFPMMKKWVDYQHSAGPEEYLWIGGEHYGDWLAMDAGEDSFKGATSEDLIASAFFARSAQLVVQAGEVLGEDVEEYRILHGKIVRAFQAYFMEDGLPKAQILRNGTVVGYGMTQTALTLILHFRLYKEQGRQRLVDQLVTLIRSAGNRMTTGFVGTPYLLHVLSDNGYTDLAYTLLLQEQSPSWLYSVNHGATTMWEHWNGIKEDGSFWSADMNSFNHYAYGAVFDWIFGVAAGIKPIAEAPAYRHVLLAPHPDKALGFLDAAIASRNGEIRVHWYYKGDQVYYEFTIPDGVTAQLCLPSRTAQHLAGGRTYHFVQ